MVETEAAIFVSDAQIDLVLHVGMHYIARLNLDDQEMIWRPIIAGAVDEFHARMDWRHTEVDIRLHQGVALLYPAVGALDVTAV